jgi:hypothetical protein
MRQTACGLGNDVGIPSVRLGFTRMQVSNASHGKPRQISHQHAFVTGYCHRQCSHRRGLIHDEQDLSMFFELAD